MKTFLIVLGVIIVGSLIASAIGSAVNAGKSLSDSRRQSRHASRKTSSVPETPPLISQPSPEHHKKASQQEAPSRPQDDRISRERGDDSVKSTSGKDVPPGDYDRPTPASAPKPAAPAPPPPVPDEPAGPLDQAIERFEALYRELKIQRIIFSDERHPPWQIANEWRLTEYDRARHVVTYQKWVSSGPNNKSPDCLKLIPAAAHQYLLKTRELVGQTDVEDNPAAERWGDYGALREYVSAYILEVQLTAAEFIRATDHGCIRWDV